MLSMQRPLTPVATTPALRHNEEHDWWILSLAGELKAGEEQSRLRIELVIVGQASE